MPMSADDFKMLAHALYTARPVRLPSEGKVAYASRRVSWVASVICVADLYEATNRSFDRETFYQDCGHAKPFWTENGNGTK